MEADVTIIDSGSIILLQPETEQAREWFEENIGRENGYQPYWPTVTCEARYADQIIEGLADAGLEVQGGF